MSGFGTYHVSASDPCSCCNEVDWDLDFQQLSNGGVSLNLLCNNCDNIVENAWSVTEKEIKEDMEETD